MQLGRAALPVARGGALLLAIGVAMALKAAMSALPLGRFVLASVGGLLTGALLFFDVTLFGGPELLARVLAIAATVLFGVLILRADGAIRAFQRLTGLVALGFLAPLPVIYRAIVQARAPGGHSMPAADAAEGAIGIAFFLGAAISALLFVLLTVLVPRGAQTATPPPAPPPGAASEDD